MTKTASLFFFCFFLPRVVSLLTFSLRHRSPICEPVVTLHGFLRSSVSIDIDTQVFPPPFASLCHTGNRKRDFHLCGRFEKCTVSLCLNPFSADSNEDFLAPLHALFSSLITTYWPVYLFWHNITSACVPFSFAAAPAETEIPVETGPRSSFLKNAHRSKKR